MHATVEQWAAAGGDVARLGLYASIGRVAPFVGDGRCLASLHPSLPAMGAVGDWTGGDAVRAEAEDWLRAAGCRVARGPQELCTWFRYRASLGPWDEAPFTLEPTEPAARWEAAGYRPVAHYASAVAEHAPQIANAVAPPGWSLHTLPGRLDEAAFRDAVSVVHRLSSAAFADAFGFAPVPEAALQAWYAPIRPAIDPRLVLLALAPDGSPGGFLFALPDADRARGWFLVKTLAVLPEHRRLRIGSWLVGESHRRAAEAGYTAGVHCLMWTGSHSNAISQHGGRVFRRYALLEKAL